MSSLKQLEELVSSAEPPHDEPSAKKLPLSPQVQQRDVVATSKNSDEFGVQLAARAWSLGLFQAQRKAYVADGSSWLWTIWERWFKPYGFVPILDIIHAVTHVYAAATAGRPLTEGGTGLLPLDQVGLAGRGGEGDRRTRRAAGGTRVADRR